MPEETDKKVVDTVSPYLEDVRAESDTYTGAYSFDEMSRDKLNNILSITIVHDAAASLTAFLALCLNYTREQQQNIGFTSVSASGKTYIINEVADFFPREDVLKLHHSSPKSFFHEHGALVEDLGGTDYGKRVKPQGDYVRESLEMWQEENPRDETKGWRDKWRTEKARLKDEWDKIPKAHLVDLESKILIFLDQPHWQLMDMLKPLLSHDSKITRSSIVEKTKAGSQASKIVFLRGYPSVIFLTVKTDLDEQIKNRMFLLSASTGQEKIQGSLDIICKRRTDEGFAKYLEEHPNRVGLKERMQALKESNIERVVWHPEMLKRVKDRFLHDHQRLKPRSQRDFPRYLALIEAHSLLNFNNREHIDNGCIYVDEVDVREGHKIYDKNARPNELGIEPELYYFTRDHLEPALREAIDVITREVDGRMLEEEVPVGIGYVRFRSLWYDYTGSHLSDRQLKRKIEQLEMIGRVERGTDPEDRRTTKLYTPTQVPDSARTRAADEPSPQETLSSPKSEGSEDPPGENPTPVELGKYILRLFDKDIPNQLWNILDIVESIQQHYPLVDAERTERVLDMLTEQGHLFMPSSGNYRRPD